MNLCDINPHIRFAEQIFYQSEPIVLNAFDCRIFYVISGELKIAIKDQHYNLTNDCMFFCASGSIYTISSPKGCDVLCLNFDLTQNRNEIIQKYSPANYSPEEGAKYFSEVKIDDCDFLNSYLYTKATPAIYNKIKNIIRDFSMKKVFYREKSSAKLKDVIIDIYRSEQPKNDLSHDAIENVISYIHENIDRKIQNTELAEIAGYHEYYLNRIFTKHTGMTLHHYIMEMRVTEARYMIMNTDMPLYRIAEATGFNNNAHFASSFKKIVGCTPSEYKNNHKNKI